MSSYEPFKRAPTNVIEEAIGLWKLRTPPTKNNTERALRLLEKYNSVIDGLSSSEHPYDEVILTELKEARDRLQTVINQRLQKEVYGEERSLLKEVYGK